MNGKLRRVGIVGTGWVGSSVAISLLHSGVADELLLSDARAALAEGEAMDLVHGSSFYPDADVFAVDLEAMEETDVVVLCAGRGGRPNESRLDLLRDNASIATQIATRLQDYEGIVIVVANPVDVLTHVVREASGLPAERVIGTGTMLDTSRLREVLGRELRLSPRSVHAHVVGEHGDSEVVLWSSARIGGTALREWPAWDRFREDGFTHEVRTAAQEIIQRKGATNHAIGLVTASLAGYVLRDEGRVLTVSRLQTEGALAGVTLSLPSRVGSAGASASVLPPMDDAEAAALDRSAGVLAEAVASIQPR